MDNRVPKYLKQPACSSSWLAAGNRCMRCPARVCRRIWAEKVPLDYESIVENQLHQNRYYHRRTEKDRGSSP